MTAPTDNPYSAAAGNSPAHDSLGYAPPPPPANNGRGFTIAGFVLAVLALGIFPIIVGPIGAVLGFVGHSKGDPKGKIAGILAIVCTVIGMIVGAVVVSRLR